MVRSALTAALGLPVDAAATTGLAQARTPLPAPPTLPGTMRPLQPGTREPPRLQAPHVAQVAKAPTFPTAASPQPAAPASSAGQYASSTSAAPAAGNASTSSSLAAASGGSLAALIGQPLPMAPDAAQPVLPASAVVPSSTAGLTAASQPLSTPANAPRSVPEPIAASPSAAPAAAPAASTSVAPVATHHLVGLPSSQPALPASSDQQQQVQPLGVTFQAGPPSQAPPTVKGSPATSIPGLHSSSGAQPAASAVALPYSSAQQQPQAPVSAGLSQPPPGSSLQASVNGGQAVASGGQQRQAGLPTAVRPVGPAHQGAAGQGRASSGQQIAPVVDDVWQLASDVMAAGGTATTAAAVTTAAQQVRHSHAMLLSGIFDADMRKYMMCTANVMWFDMQCVEVIAEACFAFRFLRAVFLGTTWGPTDSMWSGTAIKKIYREPYSWENSACISITVSCQNLECKAYH